MWLQRIRPIQINHVALRVRDLRESAAFYCDMFGLEVRPAVPPGDSVCVCAAPSASSWLSFGIALIQGLPGGMEPVGMDHISLEVARAEDVEDLYCAAIGRGVQATEPRAYGGFYQTFIFDPDGYKIEVVSKEVPVDPRQFLQVPRNGVRKHGREAGAIPASLPAAADPSSPNNLADHGHS